MMPLKIKYESMILKILNFLIAVKRQACKNINKNSPCHLGNYLLLYFSEVILELF